MKQFLKSAFSVSFGTLLSRISGFVRDIFIAKYLGSGFYSDIFFMAFRIPNFFRKIFAEGAFNCAFTPIFASGVQAHGKKKMMIFARNLYSILLYFLLVFTLIAEIFMPYLMYVLAPGYLGEKEKFDLVVILTRITFPYLIFISLVSFMSDILNTFNKFFVASVAPVFLNLVLIIFIVIFKKSNTLGIAMALSYGVSVAGVAQLLFLLIFTLKEKVFLYPVFPKITPTAKHFFSKFSNSFLASGITQINSMINSVVATLIPSAVSILYYADRVSQMPLSLIGTAISISILPALSKALSKRGNLVEAQELQENSIFLSCFLGIPSGVALFVLAKLVIEVLFQRGQFSANDTIHVANALKIYSIAIPFFILVKILQTVFYAKKDTKTPMKNSLYCLIINIILSLSLVFFLGANGIAIATTISSIYATISLFYKLVKDGTFNFSDCLQTKLLKILYVSIIMGIFILCTDIVLLKFELSALFRLLIDCCIGGIIFFALSQFFKILNIKELYNIIKKERKIKINEEKTNCVQ